MCSVSKCHDSYSLRVSRFLSKSARGARNELNKKPGGVGVRQGRFTPTPLPLFTRSFRLRAPPALSKRNRLLRRLRFLQHFSSYAEAFRDRSVAWRPNAKGPSSVTIICTFELLQENCSVFKKPWRDHGSVALAAWCACTSSCSLVRCWTTSFALHVVFEYFSHEGCSFFLAMSRFTTWLCFKNRTAFSCVTRLRLIPFTYK